MTFCIYSLSREVLKAEILSVVREKRVFIGDKMFKLKITEAAPRVPRKAKR